MSIPIYVVDAFTNVPFAGNPAAVCLLECEADPAWMQSVAMEMKHAETAFVRPIEGGFELRWFTPATEVNLCGHATLASAHALWHCGRLAPNEAARFLTRSGWLTATKAKQIRLDFPADPPTPASLPHEIVGLNPVWTGHNRMDWVIEVFTESELTGFVPDHDNINAMGMRGLEVTAKGRGEFDFIARFFAPQSGVPEDPVTGSMYCGLGPYWVSKLGKTRLRALQASPRTGVVSVEVLGDRVGLFGDAVTTLEGVLTC